MTAATITRKEICALVDNRVSERLIGYREKDWGLDKCRVPYCRRPIQYLRSEALVILCRLKLYSAT